MERESESDIKNRTPARPHCMVEGCGDEPTLATDTKERGYVFFCDKHREDKRLEHQRDANWRHKMKTKHGIIIPKEGNHAKKG